MKLLLRLLYSCYRLSWRITRPMTVGVRVILIRENRVMLVKHSYEPYWYVPGGGVKRGETIEQAARRESREEAGAELGQLHLLGVYTNLQEYKSDHVTVFYCTDFSINAKKNHGGIEIEDSDFFEVKKLPDNISPGTRRRIYEYLNQQTPVADIW